jgi:hypothetical protein
MPDDSGDFWKVYFAALSHGDQPAQAYPEALRKTRGDPPPNPPDPIQKLLRGAYPSWSGSDPIYRPPSLKPGVLYPGLAGDQPAETSGRPFSFRDAWDKSFRDVWNKNKAFVFNSLWFWGVAIVPFVLIVIFRGWDETFRSGEAYLYLIGVTVAVLGEVGIELAENGISSLKQITPRGKASAIIDLTLCLAAAAWGVVLVVKQPRVHHPTTSWVQVVVFFLALSYLTATRFAFKGETSIFTRFYGSSAGNGA